MLADITKLFTHYYVTVMDYGSAASGASLNCILEGLQFEDSYK